MVQAVPYKDIEITASDTRAGRRRVISGAQDLAFDDCDSWLFVVLLQVHVPEDASEAGPGSALPGSA